jgi:probable HAF family extracellular repeat protein
MRSSRICITLALLAWVVILVRLAAQENAEPSTHHHKYKLIDMGTFGGPNSLFSNPDSRVINNGGVATGAADTSIRDPFDPNCFFDCWVDHGFVWENGIVTDLGTLPGGASSFPVWVNDRGLIVGQSQNGLVDPSTGFPEADGVLWNRNQIISLGTLGGNQSNANAINNDDQVVGGALNSKTDPFAGKPLKGFGNSGTFAQTYIFTPAVTETHAFLWQNGEMQDLGTLGGPDSNATVVNDRGEITGESFINSVANRDTGVPTIDPFLWMPCDRDPWDSAECKNEREGTTAKNGKMLDLGTLGGTFGAPYWLNNRGQVVGLSNLRGDKAYHPFLWTKPGPMQDLGTLGGNTGIAFWVNDAGEVVGQSDLAGTGTQLHHATLWKDGKAMDLGTVDGDPCSRALSINRQGQIVGASTDCTEYRHAFLWENGGPMLDLNTLILPGSNLTAREGDYINDRGEIAGRGVLPNGDVHAILLIPCHPEDNHCDSE